MDDLTEDLRVEILGRLGARGRDVERRVELRQVAGVDADVELAQPVGTESELAPLQRPSLDRAATLERAEPSVDRVGGLQVSCARREVEPDRVVSML